MSGELALSCLQKINAYTYTREDLDGQRRLGLMAQDVEDHIVDVLGVDNVVSSKWTNGSQFKTLDYSRLTAVLIAGVNKLSKHVKDLESTVNGSAS